MLVNDEGKGKRYDGEGKRHGGLLVAVENATIENFVFPVWADGSKPQVVISDEGVRVARQVEI